ncbi:hypothetical protein PITCH_A1620016 [uncultured Desulfobacterium sp.]|uniref:Uncharacterized protein n=1 Tax=uncultured Desulfobacterium sp. TaxID=201089 RepID=A0A445MU87_9BACT|nr:hypothetical protein PITCH_A1620016 [uncultured Desulfobacterium sp.]
MIRELKNLKELKGFKSLILNIQKSKLDIHNY